MRSSNRRTGARYSLTRKRLRTLLIERFEARHLLAASITNARIFYNDSGYETASGVNAAVDTAKVVLRAGVTSQSTSFANVSSYTRGLNGLVIDVENLASSSLATSDFVFRYSPPTPDVFTNTVSAPSTWQTAPAPKAIVVTPGTTYGSSRIRLEWTDNAIQDCWLQVIVLANGKTGLAKNEVLYVGNARGEVNGNSPYQNTTADQTLVQSKVSTTMVSVNSAFDVNKDRRVTSADVSYVQSRISSIVRLRDFSVPASGSADEGLPTSTISATSTTIDAVDDISWSGIVATFSNTQVGTTADSYQITIDWGDGTSSSSMDWDYYGATPTVESIGPGQFAVRASHTFNREADFNVVVTIAPSQGYSAFASQLVKVAGAKTIYTSPGINFTQQEIATVSLANNGYDYTDYSYGTIDPSHYQVSVDWGDGSPITTSGVTWEYLAQDYAAYATRYRLIGNHSYASLGDYEIRTTITPLDSWLFDDNAGTPYRGFSLTKVKVVPQTLVALGNSISVVDDTQWNGSVATFTDPEAGTDPSMYRATISWGNAYSYLNPTEATITSLGNGKFAVNGSYHFSQEADLTLGVSINKIGGPPVYVSSQAKVYGAKHVFGSVGTLLDIELTSLVVASNNYSYSSPTANYLDYQVSVDWGDGTTTTNVQWHYDAFRSGMSSSRYRIHGSHAYANPGNYEIRTTITPLYSGISSSLLDDGSGTLYRGFSNVQVTTVPQTLSATANPIEAVDDESWSGIIATFTDTDGGTDPSLYSALVDWGDSSSGYIEDDYYNGFYTIPDTNQTSIESLGNGRFAVRATHTYTRELDATVVVTISKREGASITATSSAKIYGAKAIVGSAGSLLDVELTSVELNSFVYSGAYIGPQSFQISVNWGDGTATTSALWQSQGWMGTSSSNPYRIRGSHVYTTPGEYEIRTTITAPAGYGDVLVDDISGSPHRGFSVTKAKAVVQTLAATPSKVEAVDDELWSGVVGTFTDTEGGTDPSLYTATINWGDGPALPANQSAYYYIPTSSTATVESLGNGQFAVRGSYIFWRESDPTIVVSVQKRESASIVFSTPAKIYGAKPILGSAKNLEEMELTSVSLVDNYYTGMTINPSGYQVTINWGDGTTTTGARWQYESNGSDSFSTRYRIFGSHTYQTPGNYEIRTAIAATGSNVGFVLQDDNSVSAHRGYSITKVKIVTQTLSGSTSLIEAVDDEPWSGIVATFKDTEGGSDPSLYIATIDWGDGSSGYTYDDTFYYYGSNSSQATIESTGNGQFVVKGGHTYAREFDAMVTVSITKREGSSITVSGPAKVYGARQAYGSSATSLDMELTSVSLVNYDYDTGLWHDPSNYQVTVNWGDGTTTTSARWQYDSSTSNSYSTRYRIRGSHTYSSPGDYEIRTSIVSTNIYNNYGLLDDLSGYQHRGYSLTKVKTVRQTLSASPSPISAVDDESWSGIVATFTDSEGGTDTSLYSAIIDWENSNAGYGYNYSSSNLGQGSIQSLGNGRFAVRATHTFNREADPLVLVTIKKREGASIDVSSPAKVYGAKKTFGSAGSKLDVELTSLLAQTYDYDMGTYNYPSNYLVKVDWGDGTPITTSGVTWLYETNGSGSYSTRYRLKGTHTYATPGDYEVRTEVVPANSIFDDFSYYAHRGYSLTQVKVVPQTLTATPGVINTIDDETWSGIVATFSDTLGGNDPSVYQATIDWGDGTNQGYFANVDGSWSYGNSGTIVALGGGRFAVRGSHTYTSEASPVFSVSIQRFEGASVNTSSTAKIYGAKPIYIVANSPLVRAELTTIVLEQPYYGYYGYTTDQFGNPIAGTPAAYNVSVNWGDGTPVTTSGIEWEVVSTQWLDYSSRIRYRLRANHTYATSGNYEIVTTLTPVSQNYQLPYDDVSYQQYRGFSVTLATSNPLVAVADSFETVSKRGVYTSSGSVLANDIDMYQQGRTVPVVATLVNGPAHGTLQLQANGNFTYEPLAGFTGTDTFSYFAHDDKYSSNVATVSILVSNHAPVAGNDLNLIARHSRQTILAINANDRDDDGDSLQVSITTAPTHGSITLRSDGNVGYVPAIGYTGPDSFQYRLWDGDTFGNIATVTLDVVNNAPVASNATYSLIHDRSLTKLLPATDADLDTLQIRIKSLPKSGTLVFDNFYWTYTPKPNSIEDDSFVYTVFDGVTESGRGTITLDLTNAAPIARPDNFKVSHNGSLIANVRANDGDPDFDVTTFSILSYPEHGQLDIHDTGEFVFTPFGGILATTTFTYELFDGIASSGPATVTIEITNDKPIAKNDSFSVFPGRPLVANVFTDSGIDSDLQNDLFEAEVVQGVSHGSLRLLSDGNFAYSPSSGFVGTDSFTYRIWDRFTDKADANVATVTLTIRNNAPNAVDDTVTVAHDRLYQFDMPELANTRVGRNLYRIPVAPVTASGAGILTNDTEPDGQPVTFSLVTGPAHGILSFDSDGSYRYQPTAGYEGPDSFTYALSDGELSDTATVNINVLQTLSTPVTSFQVRHDLWLDTVLYPALDAEKDQNSILWNSSPGHGTLTIRPDGTFRYVPVPHYAGPDSFTYQFTDGLWVSPTITVNIDVTNNVPLPNTSRIASSHDRTITELQNLIATDHDGDNLTLTVTSPPSHGQITRSGTTWSYVPTSGYAGFDSFHYTITDGIHSTSGIANLDIVNTAPVAMPDSYKTGRGVPVSLQVTRNDVDAEDLNTSFIHVEVISSTPASAGSLQLTSDNRLVFTPSAAFKGEYKFQYRLFDGLERSSIVESVVNVTQESPTAQADHYGINHDQKLTTSSNILSSPWQGVLSNDSDEDKHALTATLVTDTSPGSTWQLQYGTLEFAPDGNFTYTPKASFAGVVTFVYGVTDGFDSVTQQVTIDVNNDAPIPYAPQILSSGKTIYPKDLGSDRQSDAMQIQFLSLPSHGTLVPTTSGGYTFNAAADFVDTEQVRFVLSDGIAQSVPGTLFLTLNRAPVTADSTYTLFHGQTAYISVSAPDPDRDQLQWTVVQQPAHGSVKLHSQMGDRASFEYKSDLAYKGIDQFVYQVTDGTYVSQATVKLDVQNTPPKAANKSYTVKNTQPLLVPPYIVGEVQNGPRAGEIIPLGDNYGIGYSYFYYLGGIGNSLLTWALSNEVDGRYSFDTISSSISDQEDYWGLKVVVRKNVEHGSLAIDEIGRFTYTPNPGFVGLDTFTYQVFDGAEYSPTATISINVTNTNQAPKASNFSATVNRNASIELSTPSMDKPRYEAFSSSVSDSDNDRLSIQIESQPTHGQLTPRSNGSLLYTPSPNFSGTDYLVYRAFDGTSVSGLATVTFNVINDRPLNQGKSVGRNGVLTGKLEVSNPGSGIYQFSLLGSARNGVFNLQPDGQYTYTPNANFVGYETLVVVLDAQQGSSTFGTLTIFVEDHAPIASADSYVLLTNQTTLTGNVLVNDRDLERQTLSARLVPASGPKHGTVTLSPTGDFVYQATPGYVGNDSFAYVASDQFNGQKFSDSLPTTVTITVSPFALQGNVQTATAGVDTTLTLATFDYLGTATAADFTAQIDWNDGNFPSAGSVIWSNNHFQVVGTHTYYTAGAFAPTITVLKSGTQLQLTTKATINVAYPAVTLSPVTVSAVKESTATLTLASFVDFQGLAADKYSVVINWGDNSSSSGEVRKDAYSNNYTVVGWHRYAKLGTYPVSFTLWKPGAAPLAGSTTANVRHTVIIRGLPVPVDEDGIVDGIVSNFTSDNSLATAEQFAAVIVWGDGTSSPGTVKRENGYFNVYGRHRYSAPGDYSISTEVTDDDPSTSSASYSSKTPSVKHPLLRWYGSSLAVTEDAELTNVTLVQFLENDELPGSYTAEINWGDQTSSTGTVGSATNGWREIQGTHTYKEEGSYKVQIKITGPAGISTTATANVIVQGLKLTFAAASINFNPVGGQSRVWQGSLGTLTDNDPSGQPYHYNVFVTWPQGVSGSASLSAVSGGSGYELKGSMSFAGPGTYSGSATVYIREGNRSIATGSIVINAVIPPSAAIPLMDTSTGSCPNMLGFGLPPLLPTMDPNVIDRTVTVFGVTLKDGGFHLEAGTEYADMVVGTVEGTLTNFKYEIDWGDGTDKSTGDAGATIKGTHKYNSPGTYRVTTTISSRDTKEDPRTFTITSGAFVVASAITVTTAAAGTGKTQTALPKVLIATAQGSDKMLATVEWGDGSTSALAKSAGTNSELEFSGDELKAKHVYQDPGFYTVRTTFKDEGRLKIVETKITIEPKEGWPSDVIIKPLSSNVANVFKDVEFTDIELAIVQDTGPMHIGTFHNAAIDWGDGTKSTGRIRAGSAANEYKILGSHKYTVTGSHAIRITYQDQGVEQKFVVTAIVKSKDMNPISTRSVNTANSRGSVISGRSLDNELLATFTTTGGNFQPSDFVTTVDWGDGSRSAANIVGSGTSFWIYGSHAYTSVGTFTGTVLVYDASVVSNMQVGTFQARVGEGVAGAYQYYEGGTFKIDSSGLPLDSDRDGTNDYTVKYPDSYTIDWGDGSDTYKQKLHEGFNTVSGQHLYATSGARTIHATVAAGANSATSNRNVFIANDGITVTDFVGVFYAIEQVALASTSVMVIAPTNFSTPSYLAEVDWGDGHKDTVGPTDNLDGTFTITLSGHEYKQEGDYTVAVQIKDGTSRAIVKTLTAKVIEKDVKLTAQKFAATVGEETGDMVLAIADNLQEADLPTLKVAIDWGDGKSTGKARWNQATSKVELIGSHKYTRAGSFDVIVQLDDKSLQPISTKQKAVKVSEAWTVNEGTGIKDGSIRADDFQGGFTISVGTTSVGLNTGNAMLAHAVDLDLSPGSDVSGNSYFSYNSGTIDARPVMEAVIKSKPGTPILTKIQVQLTWADKDPQAWITYTPTNHQPGDDYIVGAQVQDKIAESGVFDWKLRLKIFVAGQSEAIEVERTGKAEVVVQQDGDADTADPFDTKFATGAGWNLNFLDRLLFDSKMNIQWIDGDGLSRVFTKDGANYKSPANDFGKMERVEVAGVVTATNPKPAKVIQYVYKAKDTTRYTFNHFGLLLEIKPPQELATSITYNAEGRPKLLTVPDGSQTTFVYTGDYLDKLSTPGSRTIDVTTDTSGMAAITDAAGTRTFTRDASGKVTDDKIGVLSSEITYDPKTGGVNSVTLGGVSTTIISSSIVATLDTSKAFNSVEHTAVVKSPQQSDYDSGLLVTRYRINNTGGVEKILYPDNSTEVWDLEKKTVNTTHFGAPLSYTNRRGVRTTYVYDFALGGKTDDLRRLVEADGTSDQIITEIEYHPQFHLPTKVTKGLLTTSYQYDASGNLRFETNPYLGVTQYQWSNGFLTAMSDGQASFAYSLDSYNRVQSVVDGEHNFVDYSYDPQGNLDTVNHGGLYVEDYDYDPVGRLIATGLVGLTKQQYQYDPSGLVTLEIAPPGYAGILYTRHVYDARGLETSTTLSDSVRQIQATIQDYFPAGNLKSVTDYTGTTMYEPLAYATHRVNVKDPKGSWSYSVSDANGNIIETQDVFGLVSRTEYDALDRVTKQWPNVTDYANAFATTLYDSSGRVSSQTGLNGATTSYAYSGVTTTTTLPNSQGTEVTEVYPTGRTKSVKNRYGGLVEYLYDAAGNQSATITKVDGPTTASSKIATTTTVNDTAGRVRFTYVTNANGGLTKTETVYDGVNRVSKVILDEPGFGQAKAAELLQTYYGNGQVASQTDAMGNVTIYQYDILGRPTYVTSPASNSAYAYSLGPISTTTVTDSNSGTMVTQTDLYGRTLAVQRTDIRGNNFTAVSNVYDDTALTVTSTDALGNVTRQRLNHVQQPLETIYNGYSQGTTTYYADGSVETVSNSLDRSVHSFNYDGLGRKIVDTMTYFTTAPVPVQTTTRTFYDDAARKFSVVTPAGDSVDYKVDGAGRVIEERMGRFGTRTYEYTASGVLAKKTDRNERVKLFSYDNWDRAIAEQWLSGAGNMIRTSYRPDGKPIRLADDNSSYDYTYDNTGLVDDVELKLPTVLPGKQFKFDYGHNADQSFTTREILEGGSSLGKTETSRDMYGRVVHVSESGSTLKAKAVDFVFSQDFLTSIDRHAGSTAIPSTIYTPQLVNGTKRVSMIEQGMPNMASQVIHYDPQGRLLDVRSVIQTVPQELREYVRNDKGEIIGFKENGNTILDLQFDNNGSRIGITEGFSRTTADSTSSYRYDDEGNVVEQARFESKFKTGTLVNSTAITTTAASSATTTLSEAGAYRVRISPIELSLNNAADIPKVKVLGRLYYNDSIGSDTLISERTFEEPLTRTSSKSYFWNGDAWDVTIDSARLTHGYYLKLDIEFTDNTGWRVGIYGGYSVKGELSLEQNQGAWFNDYDSGNRLVKSLNRNGAGVPTQVITYSYDVLGNRIGRVVSDMTTSAPPYKEAYVPEQGKTLLTYSEVLGAMQLKQARLYAGGNQLQAVDDFDIDKTIWVFPDYQQSASVLYVSDTIVGFVKYDPYGRPEAYRDPSELGKRVTAGYLGMDYDSKRGSYWDGSRNYDPVAGRYETESPAGFLSGQTNLYQFAGNSPADRTGRSSGSSVSAWEYYSVTERLIGGVQTVAGGFEIAAGITGGALTCVETLGLGCAAGLAVAAHGADTGFAGLRTLYSGKVANTYTQQGATFLASGMMSQENAERVGAAVDLVVGLGSGFADDAIRAGGLGLKSARAHAAVRLGVQGGGAAAGAVIGGVTTQSWDGALMGANVGSMVGGVYGFFKVSCFTAGTPLVVDLEGNSRPIDEIEVGDYVLARSEVDPDGPVELKRVEEKFVRISPVMELVIEGRSIKTTVEHPFYVPAQQSFVPAGQLQVGDELVSHAGRLLAITKVNSTEQVTTVYNMRVADHHTYFVGGNVWGWDVWVHNARYISAIDGENVLSHFQGSLVSLSRADTAFRNPQRLLVGATEAHHPFFRMFLRSMFKSGVGNPKTASGRYISQALAYLDPAAHRLLHMEWDSFVAAKGLSVLQAVNGNGAKLAKQLANGRITPKQIFDNLDEFFLLMASKNIDGAGDAWLSLKSLRSRMGH